MKTKYQAFCLFLITCILIWNFLDFLFGTLISHTAYQFTFMNGVGQPLLIAVVMGYFFILKRDDKN